MMKIKFNDNKELTLKFGVRFVDELNRILGIEQNHMNLGMGVINSLTGLNVNDPAVLAKVLYASAYDNSPRPSLNDIHDFLDSGKGDIAKLCSDILSEYDKSNSLKAMVKGLASK